MEAGLILSRFAHFAALALLVGVGWAPAYATLSEVKAGLRWAQRAAVVVALASGLSWFAFAVAGMAGTPSAALDLAALQSTVQETGFGHVWLVRLCGIALLAGLMAFPSPARIRWCLEAFLAAALLASIALTGHAQAQEGSALLVHETADALHLLAAGVWLGALAVLVALLSRSGTATGAERARTALHRFSTTGMIAVGLIVLTGVVNGYFLVGSLGPLVTTPYGQLLCLKIALFGGMVGLAALNRGAAQRPNGASLKPMTARVAMEQLLGLCVLGAAALLGTMAPAAEMS